ncbi:uncharacterized protein [Macrobrachium rosenbergii]|uniref:uncharacterized protein n=1 Tax=Macrobrachium rosenbergii TaxID=79674 RepID=UPI0034D79257
MERALRPERLDILPTSPGAARVFKHWLFIFSRYKNATEGTNDVYLGMLANALSPENFELISDCSTYDDAITKLNKVFIQPANEIVSRHRLATRRQMSGETIDEYLRALHKLSVNCNFKDVSSEVYRDESIRDAFIAGISSHHIRTRSSENFISDNILKNMKLPATPYSGTISMAASHYVSPISGSCNVDIVVNGHEYSSVKFLVLPGLCADSAYHLVPLPEEDRPYTAFEADSGLYQFTRLCFGLTNGVAAFQRIINDIIRTNGLEGVYAYLDDVVVCGNTQEEHDENLRRFMEAARRYNMILNEAKCVLSSHSIRILGYEISHNELRPDPSRLEALMNMPVPQTKKSLQRLTGLFAYYSRWIPRFF